MGTPTRANPGYRYRRPKPRLPGRPLQFYRVARMDTTRASADNTRHIAPVKAVPYVSLHTPTQPTQAYRIRYRVITIWQTLGIEIQKIVTNWIHIGAIWLNVYPLGYFSRPFRIWPQNGGSPPPRPRLWGHAGYRRSKGNVACPTFFTLQPVRALKATAASEEEDVHS